MKGRVWVAALSAAVVLLTEGLMFAHFAAVENSYAAMEPLPASAVSAGTGHPAWEGQIDINSASIEELDKLPGIGPVKAAAIVAWRELNGPFRYPEELIRVPGIGEGILGDILDLITAG